jgi:type III secretory pathway component EscV
MKIPRSKPGYGPSLPINSSERCIFMFLDILDKYIIPWLETEKIKNLFSKKNKPDVIIKNDNNYIIALRYDKKYMIAPIISFKGRNIYGEKLKFIAEQKKIAIFEENDLVKDLFKLRINEFIPYNTYEKIAQIFASTYKNNKQVIDTQFEDIYKVQRNKNQEILSIRIPDKVCLELSNNLYYLIGENKFQVEILGVQINKIMIVNNRNFDNNEYSIKINGIDVNKSHINIINFFSSISNFTSEDDYLNMIKYQIYKILEDSLEPHIHEIIGRDDILHLIVQTKEKYPVVIQEVIKHFTIGEIRKILHGLLMENVSISNIATILEIVADFGEEEHDFEIIIEAIRISIGRNICTSYMVDNRLENVLLINYETEQLIINNIILIDGNKYLKSEVGLRILKKIEDYVKKAHKNKFKPIIICFSDKIRKLIRNEILRKYPNLAVLCFKEIPNDIQINILEEMTIEKAPHVV